MRTLCLVVPMLLGGVEALAAQYARRPADTLRFRDVTTARVILQAPQGPVPLASEHEATVAVAFERGNSARAWYEELRLALLAPMGNQRPATDSALRRPFVLRFDPRGRVETVSAPRFPASFEGISDLSHQFEDFFLRLPAGPLTPGLTWADTVTVSTSEGPKTYQSERRFAYQVVRDTTVNGEKALVVSTRQQIVLESSQPVPGQPLRSRSRLEGLETGIFVFAPGSGRMLGRNRTGDLTGTVTYEGGPAPVVLGQQVRYENTVTALPQPR